MRLHLRFALGRERMAPLHILPTGWLAHRERGYAFLCIRQLAVPISAIRGRRSRATTVTLVRSVSVRSLTKLLLIEVGWRRFPSPMRQIKRMSSLFAIPMPTNCDIGPERPRWHPRSLLSIAPDSSTIGRACANGLPADSILTMRTMQPMLEQVSVPHHRPSPPGNQLGRRYQ